jgi:hypothetical protein
VEGKHTTGEHLQSGQGRCLDFVSQEGKRVGVGIKVYVDGSTFNGFWRDGRKHGVGVFRSAQADNRLAKAPSGRLTPMPMPMPGSLRLAPQSTENLQHQQPGALASHTTLEVPVSEVSEAAFVATVQRVGE